jgi:N-acetylmuramoyl-L-alanine amidase
MKKVAVIVGHNKRSQGAQSIEPINRSEFDFNSELAAIMKSKASEFNVTVEVFFREHQGSYTKEIKKVYSEVDNWEADYSTELHFNSAVFTVAGSEVLTSGTKNSVKFANLTQAEQVKLLNRSKVNMNGNGKTDRGVKVRKKGSRGYQSLISGKAPAIIVEPFFGSNRADTALIKKVGLEKLAIAYLTAMSKL